jgi:hypothetical protein
METSDLPIHGALVENGNRLIAEVADRPQLAAKYAARFAAFEPVLEGAARCPVCHIKFGKQSQLSEVKDDPPNDLRRYDCKRCGTQFRVGL